MTFDTFLGMCFFLCLGLAIYGFVRGFPSFIIKGALVNGPAFLASLWGILAGVSNAISSANSVWWLLAGVGGAFAFICGSNLYHYLSGYEAETFTRLVARKVREMTGQGD
jgi:hypothetical protein